MGQVGETFDPNLHNAVAHIEDESLGENVIAAVYQKGYKLGDRVVRHEMCIRDRPGAVNIIQSDLAFPQSRGTHDIPQHISGKDRAAGAHKSDF